MIRLTTLGAADLRDGRGHPVRDILAQPKRLALLAYLALEGRRQPVQRDQILATFWPTSDRERGRNALSQSLHHLRSVLGADVIERLGTALRIAEGRLWCDATAFLEAAEHDQPALALDLYRGEFFPALLLSDEPGVEAWIADQRARLRAEAGRVSVAAGARATKPAQPLRRRLTPPFAAALALTAVTAGAWTLARPAPEVDPRLLVIAPFRVIAPDSSMGFLGEGLADLMAMDLTVPGVIQVADPRTVFGAWQRAGPRLTDARERREARRLGAGQLLTGSIVGTPAHVVVSARYHAAGRPDITLRAEGPMANTAALATQLARDLLMATQGSVPAGPALRAVPVRALRSWLMGRGELRAGRFPEAAVYFDEALALDSSFAHAALDGLRAADFSGGSNSAAYARLAHANRDQLGAAGRALFDALAGPRYPSRASIREHLDAADRLVRLAPGLPDAWYLAGDLLYHNGATYGRDSAFLRAEAALLRATALDSSYVRPMVHLIQIAAWRDDTALVRRRADWYFQRDSTSDEALFLRWRVAVATGGHREAQVIEARLEDLPPGVIRRIAEWSQIEGLSGPLALRAAAAFMRRAPTDAERAYGLRITYAAALAAGQAQAARHSLAQLYAGHRDSARVLHWFLPRYLHLFGGTQAARDSALHALGRADSLRFLAGLAHEDSLLVRRLLDSLRRHELNASSSTAYYDAMLWLQAADTLSAGRAAARRSWVTGGDQFIIVLDRIAGLGLARAGDTAGAVRAWRRYLNLRAGAGPEVLEERQAVAAALARLQPP